MLKFFTLASVLCCLLTSCFLSQAKETRLNPNTRLLHNWEWTKEAWTGSDAPYMAIRQNVDRAIAPRTLAAATDLIERYKAEASRNSKDPKAQFRWAYAVIRAAKKAYFPDANDAAACSYALEGAVSPRNYEYARIRFLTAMQWGPYSALKGLGYRLTKRDPTDLKVRYDFARLLVYGTNQEQQQALIYARGFVQKFPEWAGSYSLLGTVHQELFFRSRKLSDGDKAIANYQKTIRMVPFEYDHSDTDYLIKLIRTMQKELKKNGKAR